MMQVSALGVLLLLVAGTSIQAAPLPLDFEKSAQWHPRAQTITVERARDGELPVLHVSGAITEGWNYAISTSLPLVAGQLYRFSARVRVQRLGAQTPPPYLKCEFLAADPQTNLGRAATPPYEAKQMGQWQELSIEFRAPAGAVRGWLALEKGTGGPAEVDAFLTAITLTPIDKLSAFEKYRLKPPPAPLLARRGVHPRLFLDQERVVALRAAIHGMHAPLWEEVKAQADRYVASGPPAYQKYDKHSGDEQLWQRSVGNAMPPLALVYLLTGEQKYLDAASAWALASCAYPTWGLGGIDGMDLATGHQLFGLAIVYDWCYADLDPTTLRTIRETLVRRGGAMFEAAATGQAWWSRSYLQNHLWVDSCGLATAGLALYEEVDDAALWVGLALDKFRTTMAALGPDGASHEGVGYWEYGVEYLLKFSNLAQDLLGEKLLGGPWWQQTAYYPLYLSLPREAWTGSNCVVDLGDCPRGHWYGPDYLLRRLAALHRDGHAQWLAAAVDAANIDSSEARWLNLLWYDPTVPARDPRDLPTLHHFSDMEIVSARSSWSGNEALLVFKCGPFLGHEATSRFAYDPGGGHVHPDAGHFDLFGCGEWLVRDDGYRAKFTAQHNTLLVDGKGQIGEGNQWFAGSALLGAKAQPRILRAETTPLLDQISGDAAPVYPAACGLRRYVRHLLFLKPDVLIVADEIALDAEHQLELRFHTEQEAVPTADGAFLARGKKAMLRVAPLTGDCDIAAGRAEGRDRAGKPSPDNFAIRLQTRRQQWRNAVAFSWAAAGAEPVRIQLKQAGDTWTFNDGKRAVRLNWATGAAVLGK